MQHFSDASDYSLLWRDDEHELLVASLDRLFGLDEQRDHGRVDKRAIAEIDQHVRVSGGPLKRWPEQRHCAEIVLTSHRHDRKARLEMTDLDGATVRPIACRTMLRLLVERHLNPSEELQIAPRGSRGSYRDTLRAARAPKWSASPTGSR